MQDVLVTRQQAAAEHDRVRQLAREGRTDELIRELENPHRCRLLIIRGAAASRLGLLHAAAAVGPLTKLLDDPVPEVRQAAARALGRIGIASEEVFEALLRRVANDDSDDVRGVAIGSLGELHDPAVLEHVSPFLSAPQASVRFPVFYALLLSESPEAARLAHERLRQEKWYMWPYRRRLAKDVRRFRRHSSTR
jgi:HEAT repeat protein